MENLKKQRELAHICTWLVYSILQSIVQKQYPLYLNIKNAKSDSVIDFWYNSHRLL